jgi:hypothetical protein
MTERTAGFYPAVEHCVRVHPDAAHHEAAHGGRLLTMGEFMGWLSDSNYRRDPSAGSEGNRFSVAMVFSE